MQNHIGLYYLAFQNQLLCVTPAVTNKIVNAEYNILYPISRNPLNLKSSKLIKIPLPKELEYPILKFETNGQMNVIMDSNYDLYWKGKYPGGYSGNFSKIPRDGRELSNFLNDPSGILDIKLALNTIFILGNNNRLRFCVYDAINEVYYIDTLQDIEVESIFRSDSGNLSTCSGIFFNCVNNQTHFIRVTSFGEVTYQQVIKPYDLIIRETHGYGLYRFFLDEDGKMWWCIAPLLNAEKDNETCVLYPIDVQGYVKSLTVIDEDTGSELYKIVFTEEDGSTYELNFSGNKNMKDIGRVTIGSKVPIPSLNYVENLCGNMVSLMFIKDDKLYIRRRKNLLDRIEDFPDVLVDDLENNAPLIGKLKREKMYF